tara:strand:- start:3225 stop:4481 length:1257 start_codon:yes stop_codon:yes gene_type:complete
MELFNKSKIEGEIKELPSGILNTLLKAAISVNIKSIAIVGGIVRDIITKSKYQDYQIKFNDLDLIIEGETTTYIKELQKIIGPDKVKFKRNNESYKTSEITINGLNVDIACARKETYPVPAENPIIESSTIKNDLIRRDFNINAMAIELKENKLIDLFSGLDAISNMTIDFLHELSVLEDPTRILRASRYSAKLGFNLSTKALSQIKDTINSWPWDWHIGDHPFLAPSALSTRLRMELELLFKSNDWENALANLQEWDGLKIIDSKLNNDKKLVEKVFNAKKSNIEPLTAFVYEASNPLYLAQRLQLSHHQKEVIEGAFALNKYLNNIKANQSYQDWSPSKWTTELENIKASESSFILEICRDNLFKEYLKSWLYNWKYVEAPIKGEDLIAQGWESGPELGLEIKRQRMRLIDELNIF